MEVILEVKGHLSTHIAIVISLYLLFLRNAIFFLSPLKVKFASYGVGDSVFLVGEVC